MQKLNRNGITFSFQWKELDIETLINERVQVLEREKYFDRLRQKDVTLWSSDEAMFEDISKRLDWFEAPETSRPILSIAEKLKNELLSAGFKKAIILGMGGSSLAPEVYGQFIKNLYENQNEGLNISILDSTDPEQIQLIDQQVELEKTIFIVSSKSGTTAEVNSFFKYFWEKVNNAKISNPGKHFIAISDPETPLINLGIARGFKKVITANPNVGGRFSALIEFGLIPAVLCGFDGEILLDNANFYSIYNTDQADKENLGFQLGIILAETYARGKDKLSILTDQSNASFGGWIEQLVAESTGKAGESLLPIAQEPVFDDINCYSEDRVFINLSSEKKYDQLLNDLQASNHPIINFPLKDVQNLCAYFYIWEVAVAVFCSLIGINAFDQPNVQLSKEITREMLERIKSKNPILSEEPILSNDWCDIYVTPRIKANVKEIKTIIKEFFNKIRSGDFIAINAFLPMTETNLSNFSKIRKQLTKKYKTPTTLGFGPRFLHSTGQLHKGGKNNGHFLVITREKSLDLPIPHEGITFGALQNAQAIGDVRALEKMSRHVMWIHLKQKNIDELVSIFKK